MNRKVKYAKLQTGAFIPDVGTLGDVFPPPNKALPGLSMTSHGTDGLLISFTWKGVPKEMWVPSSNVAHAELDVESSPTVSLPKAVKAVA